MVTGVVIVEVKLLKMGNRLLNGSTVRIAYNSLLGA